MTQATPSLIAVFFAGCLLVASAVQTAAAAPATTVELEMGTPDGQKVFNPDELRLPANTPVRLVLVNVSDNEHSFRAPELLQHARVELVTAESTGSRLEGDAIHVEPHGQAVFDLEIETPGPYAFACTMPGHAEWGMRGSLTVVKPAS